VAARAKKVNRSKRVDSVRASRDGHQFHGAWVARRALGLLLPRFDLYAIAVEGLSEEDEQGFSDAVVEIADATFYHGKGASFESSTRLEVAQFKYSISKAATPLRIADLRKTLVKFAATEKDFVSKHGAETVARKITYSINTNRPFASETLEAFRAPSTGQPAVSADANAQLSQLRSAVKQSDDGLRRFADRVLLVGRMDSLEAVERGNARTVADWSLSNDALARARIGELRDIVRKKAGSHGQRDKLVMPVDVLSALGHGHESELLPTPQAFPEVGNVVRRAQLSEFIATLAKASRWIVHASGGLGKTVFVQSVATELAQHNEVVLFDCFGGGAYRTLADGRHRPERGLLHIVNELACRGLCDPILPGTSDSAEVVRRSIHRFKQAIEVVRRTKPRANLFVIIDAADNAAMEAANRHQWSFPRELLESLTTQEPVEGLTVIVTARPERAAIAIGSADCRQFEIKPFTLPEAAAFISARLTAAQSQSVSAARSLPGLLSAIGSLSTPPSPQH
jgi:NACHT domain